MVGQYGGNFQKARREFGLPPRIAGMIRHEPLSDGHTLAIALKRARFVTNFEQCVANRAVALGYKALPLGVARISGGEPLADRKARAIRPEGLRIPAGDMVSTTDPVVTRCQVRLPLHIGRLEF